MADLLDENLKPEDALTAIQTALELIQGADEPAQIKFHQETGILICRGSPEQVESIQQVITQLRERAGTLRGRAQEAEIGRRNAEREQAAAAGNARMRDENETLSRQIAEWKTRAELLEHTVAEHQRLVATLENQLREMRAERDEMRRLIADLQAKAKEPTP
jgi:chromosome segregation ATPase